MCTVHVLCSEQTLNEDRGFQYSRGVHRTRHERVDERVSEHAAGSERARDSDGSSVVGNGVEKQWERLVLCRVGAVRSIIIRNAAGEHSPRPSEEKRNKILHKRQTNLYKSKFTKYSYITLPSRTDVNLHPHVVSGVQVQCVHEVDEWQEGSEPRDEDALDLSAGSARVHSHVAGRDDHHWGRGRRGCGRGGAHGELVVRRRDGRDVSRSRSDLK